MDTPGIAKHKHVQVLGLCDVDRERGLVDSWLSKYKSAKFFQDYREMLVTLGDKVDVVPSPHRITPITRPPWPL